MKEADDRMLIGEQNLGGDNGAQSEAQQQDQTKSNKVIKYFNNGEIIDLDFSKLRKAVPPKRPVMSAAM